MGSTLIKCLALLRSPRVVCLELSCPTGTISFRFSKQLRRCARLFFSNSLWVDLKKHRLEKCSYGGGGGNIIFIFKHISLNGAGSGRGEFVPTDAVFMLI